MKWLDRLLISLNLRKPKAERYRGHVPPRPMPAPAAQDWKDGDTLPFIHRRYVPPEPPSRGDASQFARRASAFIPLSQIPPIPRRTTHQLHAVPDGRDNAMGDPWVPPGGGYGAAARLVEGGEAPAPAPDATFKTGSGGEFSGGGADASWGSSDSDCSSGGDSGSSGGCGGGD